MGVTWPFANDQVKFDIEAGLSNRGQDLDNIVKPVLDTYQIIFEEFNDNKVYEITLTKTIVKKGNEFLHVRVCRLGESFGGQQVSSEGGSEQEAQGEES